MARELLPERRYLALTWGIPEVYGGMTTAMLERSKSFAQVGGAPVDIVTFDPQPDYPGMAARLRERGALCDGVSIVNLWDWLRENPLPVRKVRGTPTITPLERDPRYESRYRGDRERSRSRYAADGSTVLQVDYYRDDGSVLATDRHDCREYGRPSGRSVVLFDRDGAVTWHSRRITPLYYAWLDALVGHAPTSIIVDSKAIARWMLGYHNPRAVTIHVVHASHLAKPDDPLGGFRESRRLVFENLDRFDAVVVLTERQKHDVQRAVGRAPTVRVIPNPLPDLHVPAAAERPIGHGMMLASLVPGKRISHGIRAVAAALPQAPALSLDVFGEGEQRQPLEKLIARLGLQQQVRLRGYDPRARERLGEASFLLLTSSSEGFALVIVEAMAAGCLPIAYDVRYGPGDVIEDGRNGFLVPNGDIDAVADAILRLQRMPGDEIERMRRRARETAAEFSPEAVTHRWAREMRRAERLHQLHRLQGRLQRTVSELVAP